MKSLKKTIYIFILIIIHSCSQKTTCVYNGMDRDMPNTLQWVDLLDDTIYCINTDTICYQHVKLTGYFSESGTYYAQIERNGRSYFVIPIDTQNPIVSRAGDTVYYKTTKHEFSASKGDSIDVKLIPVFPKDELRMPCHIVQQVFFCGRLLPVVRFNPYWAIEKPKTR